MRSIVSGAPDKFADALAGRRFPLILDMDERAVDRLIKGKPSLLIDRGPNRKPEGKKRRR